MDRLLQPKLSLLHYTNSNVSAPTKAAAVLTLHDVHDLVTDRAENPQHEKKVKHKYRNIRAAHPYLITISEYSLKTILDYFPQFKGRSEVVHLGVDERFTPQSAEAVEVFRKQRGLDAPYVLFTGALGKRKNYPAFVEIFLEANRRLGGRYRLALSGRGADMVKEDYPGDLHQLVPLGYVPDEEMPLLYSGAECLLWPSLFEGFDYPIVEAMACGCPVITSRTTACGEIGRDGALLVDPENHAEVIDALEAMLTKKHLRERHREAGMTRSRHFAWQNVAKKTLDVYRAALGED